MRKFAAAALLVATAASFHGFAVAAKPDWIGTWTTADMAMETERAKETGLGTQPLTLRQVVHISQGGNQVRVRFSNEFGTAPLQIDAAHLAFLAAGSRILARTDRPLLFHGQASVTIPAGGVVASDPIRERMPIFSDLVISMAIPTQAIPTVTYHHSAYTTTYFAAGEQTGAEDFTQAAIRTQRAAGEVGGQNGNNPAREMPPEATSWFFLKDVEVNAERNSKALVAFGDSITDGERSTPETNRRWTDALVPLLAANKHTKGISVLNTGISGNRILAEGYGPSAMERFDRDVLSKSGAGFVIFLEGINDIGNGGVTSAQITAAMTELANRAHARGLRIFGGTLLPYEGAGYYTAEGEQIREQVNAFLRSTSAFDGVIDFEKSVQDPHHPTRMLPKFDSGDHLHPSDLGYAAMAAAVPLKIFQKK